MLVRRSLPARRRCITQRVQVNNQTVHYTVGLYPDGRPGELFIDVHKAGTAVRAWAGSTAKLMSIMLQYGVPLHELVDALVGDCSEPFGEVDVRGHANITKSVGILDTVVRSMALDYLAESAMVEHQEPFVYCPECGTVHIAGTETCAMCGEQLVSCVTAVSAG